VKYHNAVLGIDKYVGRVGYSVCKGTDIDFGLTLELHCHAHFSILLTVEIGVGP